MNEVLNVLQTSARVDQKPPDDKEEGREDDVEADDQPGCHVPFTNCAITFQYTVVRQSSLYSSSFIIIAFQDKVVCLEIVRLKG